MATVTEMFQLVLGLALAGFAVLWALRANATTANMARDAVPQFVSHVAYVAAVVLPITYGPWGILAGLALLAGRCAYEAALVLSSATAQQKKLAVSCAGIAACAGALAYAAAAVWAVVGLQCVVVALSITWLRMGGGEKPLGLFLIYPMLPVAALAAMARQPDGTAMLILALLLTELFRGMTRVGSILPARTQAFAALGPGLTVEGLTIGGLSLIVAALAFVLTFTDWPATRAILIAGLTFMAAIAGELLAARVRARGQAAAFPPVLDGWGGLLDRAAGWILVAPTLSAAMMTL